MLCSAELDMTASNSPSANGSCRASAVRTSTRPATPSAAALASVAAAVLPVRSSACHRSMPTAVPVVRRLAAPHSKRPRPQPTSSTRSVHSHHVALLGLLYQPTARVAYTMESVALYNQQQPYRIKPQPVTLARRELYLPVRRVTVADKPPRTAFALAIDNDVQRDL